MAVDVLIKNGADVEYDLYGSTPLFLAIFSGMHWQLFLYAHNPKCVIEMEK